MRHTVGEPGLLEHLEDRGFAHRALRHVLGQLAEAGTKPAETLMNVVGLIARRLETDVCSAYLLEPDRANLVLAASVGLRRECIGTLRESVWAVQRLAADPRWSAHPVVVALAPEVHSVPGWDPLSERGPHCVPPAWMGALDALA